MCIIYIKISTGTEIFDVETYYTCQNKNFSIDSNEIYIK